MMTEFEKERRILIIDDQSQIHETFARIFRPDDRNERDLDDFEARFLHDGSERPPQIASAAPVFSLTHAYSGESGVLEVQRSISCQLKFSVAFVDMRMPQGMDGLETIKRLWEIDSDLQVVICTAYSDHTWDEIVQTLGYSDRLLLLRKPFEHDEARQLTLALSEKFRLSILQQEKLELLNSEVNRRRKAEAELRIMAHRDALTSLPNRPFLIEKLEHVLARQGPERRTFDAILFLDLDNFKIINDSLGHEAGDELLNQVAKRLQECVRDHNLAAAGHDCTEEYTSGGFDRTGDETIRLGGDEFVILLETLTNRDDALRVARRVVQRVCEPFKLGDRLVTIGTSVGVAFIDESLADGHEALRNADTAMYQAKNSGKGQIAVFDQTMHDAVVARHDLEAQLRVALREERFELRYQPIVNLKTGQIQGVEVLSRWKNDHGEYVPPSEFVPVAEEIGMITQFGEWVLERSMREFSAMMASFDDDKRPAVYLGVNISRRQLSDPFFLDRLNAIIDRTRFKWSLKLEMSENGDSRHNERSLKTMLDLHQSGVGIHIDDFGKGNSSLTCFHDYPIETVKIDRTFTASITIDRGHAIITQAIVQLAHHLMAKIVCQGVESPRQLMLLQQWGCDLGQGYLFAPPLDIVELERLLIRPGESTGINILKTSITAPLNVSAATVNLGAPLHGR
jgi:predicted signal transduction protein with EAL and GGDEF domain